MKLVLFLALAGCAAEGERLTDVESPRGISSRPVADLAPPDNPLTEAKARLGRRLFFEPRLSRTGQISCASCHHPEHAFAEPRAFSLGVEARAGTRNAPALVNLAFAQTFFWDGRAPSLEEQVTMPIENPLEMDSTVGDAIARLRGYESDFQEALGAPASEVGLRRALATFLRTLVSGGSAYDRWLAGDDGALDAAARRGLDVFLGERGGCFHCHPPGSLTNQGFFNNGTASADTGRQRVTGRTGDLGKFKVPGLRNVAASAPYMHDGSLATLAEVIDQYDRGGRGPADPQIEPLHLTATEKSDLEAFLNALTDESFLRDPRHRAP